MDCVLKIQIAMIILIIIVDKLTDYKIKNALSALEKERQEKWK